MVGLRDAETKYTGNGSSCSKYKGGDDKVFSYSNDDIYYIDSKATTIDIKDKKFANIKCKDENYIPIIYNVNSDYKLRYYRYNNEIYVNSCTSSKKASFTVKCQSKN